MKNSIALTILLCQLIMPLPTRPCETSPQLIQQIQASADELTDSIGSILQQYPLEASDLGKMLTPESLKSPVATMNQLGMSPEEYAEKLKQQYKLYFGQTIGLKPPNLEKHVNNVFLSAAVYMQSSYSKAQKALFNIFQESLGKNPTESPEGTTFHLTRNIHKNGMIKVTLRRLGSVGFSYYGGVIPHRDPYLPIRFPPYADDKTMQNVAISVGNKIVERILQFDL